jgi:GTP-binding protein
MQQIFALNLCNAALNCKLELLKEADRFFSAPSKFMIGTTDFNIFPPETIPEFAFIGRSNVGKSSLLNSLVKQKSLARVSVTPGRTQQVNFFTVAEKLILVDLPGYGFAKAPKNLVKAWERMSLGYLKNRKTLLRLFLLIDSRHGFKNNDVEFMKQLDKFAVPYQIILTKMDKTNKEQMDKNISQAKEMILTHAAMFPDVILTSSKTGKGVEILRTYILSNIL